MITDPTDLDRMYQRIGEFVVVFQSIEVRVREIGWLLIDPQRRSWPPTQLRNVTNYDLLNRVQQLYMDTVSTFSGIGPGQYCESFRFVIGEAHRARRARNALLHSAFIELKGGSEVLGLLGSLHFDHLGAGGEQEGKDGSLRRIRTPRASFLSVAIGVGRYAVEAQQTARSTASSGVSHGESRRLPRARAPFQGRRPLSGGVRDRVVEAWLRPRGRSRRKGRHRSAGERCGQLLGCSGTGH
jgi:hypothetical protein